MELIINNEKKEFTDGASLKDVLNQLGFDKFHGLAVAVSEEIIPKEIWKTYLPEEGKEILIIHAVQGG